MATILIVDDERPIRALLKYQLTTAGHVVREAADGEEALAIARSDSFDLIFSDILLPRKDGWQVCRELKEDPNTKDIPVVILTGMHDEIAELRARECGADDYVVKPWDPAHLGALTTRLLARPKADLPFKPTMTSETVGGGDYYPPPTEKILVVEDNRSIAALLVGQLERAGYKVVTASDALQGVKIAAQQRPDVVLLDLMLPAGGGVAVLKTLRKSLYTSNTPVIVLTGSEDTSLRRQILEFGIQMFLKKPHDPKELLALIRLATGAKNKAYRLPAA